MIILSEIADFDDLFTSWKAVSKTTSEIDGISIPQFKANIVEELKKIQSELKNKSYNFSPIQKKLIGKPNSTKKRPIHLYTIRDKIVQRSIQRAFQRKRKELNQNCIFPGMFNPVSIAYLPKISAKDLTGVKKSTELVQTYFDQGLEVISCMDIESFFDRISIDILKKKIDEGLQGDNSVNWLLDQFLHPEVINIDYTIDGSGITTTGVKQGSILAPLFSNIYLQEFDSKIVEKNLKVIRYADDVAIFSVSQEAALSNVELVKQILLETASLEFYKDSSKKTKTYNLRRLRAAEFLGIRYELVGESLLRKMPTKAKINSLKEKIIEASSRSNLSLVELVTKLNATLKGWYIFYDSIGCHKTTINEAYKEASLMYEQKVNDILLRKGITQQKLSRSNLRYLGVNHRS